MLENCSRPRLLFRLLTAATCELDVVLCDFDIEQAFVQPDLKEHMYVRYSQNCGKLWEMVRLYKRFYALKQASR